jgi:hypothetical protein
MESADQLHIGDHATDSVSSYETDDMLERRLSQIENGIQHFQALLPAMAREVAIIRAQLMRAA